MTQSVSASPLRKIPDHEITLEATIAENGFGGVYKGKWGTMTVAIKMLGSSELGEEERTSDFKREAKLMNSIRHRNITTIFGITVHNKGIVMELMEASLYDLIQKKEISDWSLRKRVEILIDTANGLAFLHDLKILHRDIKSPNILIGNDGAKITDFDCSVVNVGPTTVMDKYVGTPNWMAPEIAKGKTDYGLSADVYSLSLVLWETLHEDTPFKTFNPNQIIRRVGQLNIRETIGPQTPEPLQKLMLQSWEDASVRPTAREFLNALQEFHQSDAPSLPLNKIRLKNMKNCCCRYTAEEIKYLLG